jgi:hypothetical protein
MATMAVHLHHSLILPKEAVLEARLHRAKHFFVDSHVLYDRE